MNRKERETARLEAFSDAVFAIAITLLVLNLYDPTTRGSSLLGGLLDEWPAFFAFFVSFISILVMWINHHNMFNYIKRLSREFMLLNGFLLMFVVYFPSQLCWHRNICCKTTQMWQQHFTAQLSLCSQSFGT
jgi:uncharacterized membrane protein